MPSLTCRKIQSEAEAYLGRGLTPKEVRRCEEITINFKPWVALRWLKGLAATTRTPEGVKHASWGLFYAGLMVLGKNFRGFTRRRDLVRFKGRLRRVYDQICAASKDFFSEDDLAAILYLASACSDAEIAAVTQTARIHGFKGIVHYRGIIRKNRALVLKKYPQVPVVGASPGQLSNWSVTLYPQVPLLQSIFERRLGNDPAVFGWSSLENDQDGHQMADEKPGNSL